MHVVSLIANQRNTTERRIMHDYTPRQIEHIGDAMLRDRMFVVNVISSALGGKPGKGKQTNPGNAMRRAEARQQAKARGAVDHFDRAQPGGLTPGSTVYDLRGVTQKKAHTQLCAIMGQRPKE